MTESDCLLLLALIDGTALLGSCKLYGSRFRKCFASFSPKTVKVASFLLKKILLCKHVACLCHPQPRYYIVIVLVTAKF